MPSRPSNVKASSSRERLLQAARRLFAAQGYEQTATSAIARRAETSESQLMRYFGGKVGLLEALFDEAWAELNAHVAEIVESGASARERILDVLQSIIGAAARDPDLATLLLFEGRRMRGSTPRVHVSAGLIAFSDTVKGLVREGQVSREIDAALDATALTASLLGASEAMVRERVLARAAGGRAFAEREIRRTLESMLNGFGPPAGATRRRSPVRVRRSR